MSREADRNANGAAAASGGIAIVIIGFLIFAALAFMVVVVVGVLFVVWLIWKAISAKDGVTKTVYYSSAGVLIVFIMIAGLIVFESRSKAASDEMLASNKDVFLKIGPELILNTISNGLPTWKGAGATGMFGPEWKSSVSLPEAHAKIDFKVETLPESGNRFRITDGVFRQLDRIHAIPVTRARFEACRIIVATTEFDGEDKRTFDAYQRFGEYFFTACTDENRILVLSPDSPGFVARDGIEFRKLFTFLSCKQYTDIVSGRSYPNWIAPKGFSRDGC